MSRLTQFISDPNEDKEYGIKGVCNYDLFGGIHHSQIPNLKKAIDKLAEYEDLGSVETIKSKLIEFNYLTKVHAMYGDNQQNFLNNQKLEHELEVYKRALKNEKLPKVPRLSEQEYWVLKGLKDYKYLIRDNVGDMNVQKNVSENIGDDWDYMCPYNHLFKFVKKDQKPHNIQKLLDEYEKFKENSICNYHEQCNDKVKSNFDVWNYCPNCGVKIKRGKNDE